MNLSILVFLFYKLYFIGAVAKETVIQGNAIVTKSFYHQLISLLHLHDFTLD